MLDLDKWQEIFANIRKNRLRTFLTGFSVSWGIFMLIVLLGAGNGLRNGVETQFSRDATNSVWLNAGKTSLAFEGYQPGREIKFTNEDFDLVQATYKNYEHISARMHMWDINLFSYKNNYGNFNMKGVHPGMVYPEKIKIDKGRFINDLDIKETRKVACISKKVVEEIFKNVFNHFKKPPFVQIRNNPNLTHSLFFLLSNQFLGTFSSKSAAVWISD